MTPVSAMTTMPAGTETRRPQIMRLIMSRPRSSVPNGCSPLGALQACPRAPADGVLDGQNRREDPQQEPPQDDREPEQRERLAAKRPRASPSGERDYGRAEWLGKRGGTDGDFRPVETSRRLPRARSLRPAQVTSARHEERILGSSKP